jgi:hypothetical protein
MSLISMWNGKGERPRGVPPPLPASIRWATKYPDLLSARVESAVMGYGVIFKDEISYGITWWEGDQRHSRRLMWETERSNADVDAILADAYDLVQGETENAWQLCKHPTLHPKE